MKILKNSTFRIIFGGYLMIHFFELIPYAEEVFGNLMPFDPSLNPTYNFFPNILTYINATYFILLLFLLSVMFTLNIYVKLCSFLMWYGWACLLNRNVLIHNPGISYVGWLLLAYTLISNNDLKTYDHIYWFSWFLMGAGYTISGLHKLQCPSWIDGTALFHILNEPIARDNLLRDYILLLPPIILKCITWFSLGLEILFLPLGMFYHTRFIFWMLYMSFHIGILLLINFTDLTLGVMMIHFFTFDYEWLNY